ncbi:MAG: hypothetical protein ABSD38_34075 [Syntrophorhabdales bacterium]|jgi:hypothetical protein
MKILLMLISITIALFVFADDSVYGNSDSVSKFVLPSGIEVRIVEASCKGAGTACQTKGIVAEGVFVGEIPLTYLKEIAITHKGRIYQLDTSGMFNAWGNRPLEYPGVVRYFGGHCDEKTCVIRGLFADAALTYVAEWVVVDGVPARTVLTGSQDVVDVFMKNIDGVEFD